MLGPVVHQDLSAIPKFDTTLETHNYLMKEHGVPYSQPDQVQLIITAISAMNHGISCILCYSRPMRWAGPATWTRWPRQSPSSPQTRPRSPQVTTHTLNAVFSNNKRGLCKSVGKCVFSLVQHYKKATVVVRRKIIKGITKLSFYRQFFFSLAQPNDLNRILMHLIKNSTFLKDLMQLNRQNKPIAFFQTY